MRLRESMKRLSARVFRAGDRMGLHVLPTHHYSPVASRRWLRRNELLWRKPSSLRGIRWDVAAQADWVIATAGDYPAEVPLRKLYGDAERVGGFRYGPIEAQMLHSVVRRNAPARIVEIGSGSSTLIMSDAARMNAIEGRHDSRITAIDPYPSPRLESLSNVTVRSVGGLEVTVDDLGLAAGDLLFIDSTHTVRTGSEVPYLYLDVLPQLPPGVIVQIHDIFLPHLYVPHVYSEFFDWQETTLVAALLVNNDQLEVLACMSALHEADPKALATAFPEYRPRRLTAGVYDDAQPGHFPSSLWLRTAA